ncbi:MAG: hypothetical protein AAF502_15600 [Bacteroidota bacterium]
MHLIIKKIDNWISESYPVTPGVLGGIRIVFGFYMLYLFWHYGDFFNFKWAMEYPQRLFDPATILSSFFSDFPPYLFYLSLNFLLFSTTVLVLIGYKTILMSRLMALFIIVQFSFFYVFGNIDNPILILIFPFIMSFTNWGAALSVDAFRSPEKMTKVHSWPITLYSIIVGFAFFTSGFAKLLAGWMLYSIQATQGEFLMEYDVLERNVALAPFFYDLHSPLIWKSIDWATVIFETAFVFMIFSPPMFRFFTSLAVFFHFGIFLIIDIDFSYHFMVFSIFLNWPWILSNLKKPWINKIYGILEKLIRGVSLYWVVPLFAIYFALFYFHGNPMKIPYSWIGLNEYFVNPLLIFISATCICFYYWGINISAFINSKIKRL